MPNITVTLTDTQLKGMQYAAYSPQDWCDNAITNRADEAVKRIVDIVVQHCLDNDIAVPSTREAIVTYGFDNDIVMTGVDRAAAAEADPNP
jgi:hypothetical protein